MVLKYKEVSKLEVYKDVINCFLNNEDVGEQEELLYRILLGMAGWENAYDQAVKINEILG